MQPQNLPPAKELGMTTILVGAGVDTEGADYVISGMEELASILPEIEV